ncbi:protein PFC0760c-like [Linepithema humile]|uniref:protein PFC0760c-like n=1 Tax=Linepithema humile TaxID=83485 RepID=UPI0006237330|nr:PREDICTED: protein PFC0760c-like [Linepithema humile]XP_012216807.1 PREDICTED: protein PFC0760c-like [Linepithema humile]XP_012216808.1 PREDICTED: protein PFC0760c-like [Linepithema humile]XP_012216810.1 PREDICTED: protein PFC0760c-like [Linepithema humile]XP_012216811.1 PREDICTED: protein PFC0760c-like [Linepithema humile]
MSLHKDIEKATSLKWVNENAKFVRLQGLSQAAKDRKMNERKVKKPRNIQLMEDDDNDSDNCSDGFMCNKTEPVFDKHAISAAIKEVHGGIDLSNKHLEEYWSEHLKKEKSQNFSECNDVKTYSENQSKDLNNKNVLDIQMHKLRRNAAIMGILNIKKISLEDLISSSDKNFIQEKNKLEYVSTSDVVDDDDDLVDDDNDNHYNYDYVESVPHGEEDGIFIHPLQRGIDTTKYKDVDFTSQRIGKKTKITPKSYFLNTRTDDTSYDFIKKTVQRN